MNNVFNYNEKDTFKENFSVWYYLNCKERDEWGERPYTYKQGYKVFCSIHGEHKKHIEPKQLCMF